MATANPAYVNEPEGSRSSYLYPFNRKNSISLDGVKENPKRRNGKKFELNTITNNNEDENKTVLPSQQVRPVDYDKEIPQVTIQTRRSISHSSSRTQKGSIRSLSQRKQNKSPPAPSHEIFFYIQIAFFAMCGCLSRIGIDRCFGNLAKIEDPGEIVNQSFFSNIFGCFVLGALNGSPMGTTTLAALYKGLTTGYCGSFTTWSKWNQQISLTLIGEADTHGAQSQVLSISSWFIGFYTYIGSYQVGLDFGKTVGDLIGNRVVRKGHWIADRTIALLLLLAYAGFIVGVILDASQESKEIWLAVLFAPFGACLRAYLAKYKIDRFMFPLGTFTANVTGAVILAGLHVLDYRTSPADCNAQDICWSSVVIYAVGTGFCACLTTISTFMSEIYKIRAKVPVYGYGYAIITVVVCQVLCGIINGVNLNAP